MTKTRVVSGVLVASAALLLAFVPGVRAASDDGTPWLGVYTQRLTNDLREGLSYNGSGVLVNRVVPDSPADRAGIENGDVITRVDGRDATSPDVLADLIRSHHVGDRVDVRVVHDGSTRILKVTLSGRGDEEGENEAPNVQRWKSDNGQTYDFDFDDNDNGNGTVHVFRGLDQLPMVSLSGRGRLGVRIESLTRQLGDYFQVPDGNGALVTEVVEDSPAEKAGIKAGDVITKLGSHHVDDADDLMRAVSDAEGDVSVTLVRRGATRTVEAKLGKAPRAFSFQGTPDKGQIRRMIVERDQAREMRDHARQMRDQMRDQNSDLRESIQQLREELQQMKREIEEMRNSRD